VRIDSYLKHIPTIEGWLREHKPDALVCGLGPTAWLLPWIDQSLLSGVRLWGCHNACQIAAMDDIVIMDPPIRELHPNTYRHGEIVKSRPKRLWLYRNNAPTWEPYLHPAVKSITRLVDFGVHSPNRTPADPRKLKFKLESNPPHTTAISPTGMTTLAWREGARRIGVIGVDMEKASHHTYFFAPLVDHFFATIAQQAKDLGGMVVNLSPVSSLRAFKAWNPSTSGLAPIPGSVTQAQSACSNTPSASEPPAPSSCTGCAPATSTGQSASTAILAPGS
jgi:hypothetical protein